MDKVICSSADRCKIACPHKIPHDHLNECVSDYGCEAKDGVKGSNCIPYKEPKKEDKPTLRICAKANKHPQCGSCPHAKPHVLGYSCPVHCRHERGAACIPYIEGSVLTAQESSESVIPKTKPVNATSTAAPKKAAPKKGEIEMKKSLIEKVKTAGSVVIAKQTEMAKTAMMLEGSRVLLDQATNLVRPKLPIWARGYADTPYFKAILANALMVAVEVALPEVPDTDIRKQLVTAGAVGSYQEIIGSFDLAGQLESLFSSPEMAKVIGKASKTAKAASAE